MISNWRLNKTGQNGTINNFLAWLLGKLVNREINIAKFELLSNNVQ